MLDKRMVALAFIVLAFAGGFALGGPPQRPGPLQRPPLREIGEDSAAFQWVTSSPSAAAPVAVKAKACPCSSLCTCGCVEGGECSCKAGGGSQALRPSPTPAPVPIPYYGTPVFSQPQFGGGFQQAQYSSPGMGRAGSFGGFSRGAACSSGG